MNKSSLRDFRESFRREVVTLTRNSLHDGYINCINSPFLWRDTLVQLAFQKFDTGKHGSLSVMTRNVHSNQLVASVNLRDQGVGMARNSQSARGHGILRFDAFTCLTDGGDDVEALADLVCNDAKIYGSYDSTPSASIMWGLVLASCDLVKR